MTRPQRYIKYGAEKFSWQIKQPMVHTQEGVKALLNFHLSRLTLNTQSFRQYFPW